MSRTGKCNCGKTTKNVFIIKHKDYASEIKFCDNCKPNPVNKDIIKIS